MSSSSRSLAAARAKRSGEIAPPVSGNRPITSIGSMAQQHMGGYPMPNNVRIAKAMPPSQPYSQAQSQRQRQQQPTHYEEPPPSNGLPFQKLSLSDAIGLITLRLGRVEQWIIETDHENASNPQTPSTSASVPDNHSLIDNSVLSTIIHRLDSLEKHSATEDSKLGLEEMKTLTDQFKRMSDTVNKHTIELNKNTEQVFRFNRELVETKDILKSFMVKYDKFVEDTNQTFVDYETALTELEKKLPAETINDFKLLTELTVPLQTVPLQNEIIATDVTKEIDLTDFVKQGLKDLVKQEFNNIHTINE